MKKILTNIRHRYQHQTNVYVLKRNFDQLIGQLNTASENKMSINNLDIKQPAWISGMILTHYFPDEFKADYESNFPSRRGFTNARLRGYIEKISESEIKLTLREVPAFETAYLVVPLLVLGSIYSFIGAATSNMAAFIMPVLLLIAAVLIIHINRRIFYLLKKICIDYVKSGKELAI
ncbi:hypothetical protein LWM68_06470 [Niabella sp. W65]|nr:hypothetical protein [Niabella sp. W65]MCH7362440.1 hypothetical protein [Niabella sp. W65]ULT38399.1 hypothetical protein KRR40_25095 [Niabella sp. I65]